MTTKIDIASNALLLLGHEPISSFTDPGKGAQVAANFYDITYEAALTHHPWRFAIGKAQLARLAAVPENEWDFAYQLPTGHLAIYRTYPEVKYEIFENKLLYTNADKVEVDYWLRPDESKLPSYFVEYMEFRLAAKFAYPVTKREKLTTAYSAEAKTQLLKAKFIDSQGRPNKGIQDAPFIEARF